MDTHWGRLRGGGWVQGRTKVGAEGRRGRQWYTDADVCLSDSAGQEAEFKVVPRSVLKVGEAVSGTLMLMCVWVTARVRRLSSRSYQGRCWRSAWLSVVHWCWCVSEWQRGWGGWVQGRTKVGAEGRRGREWYTDADVCLSDSAGEEAEFKVVPRSVLKVGVAHWVVHWYWCVSEWQRGWGGWVQGRTKVGAEGRRGRQWYTDTDVCLDGAQAELLVTTVWRQRRRPVARQRRWRGVVDSSLAALWDLLIAL